MGPRPAARAEIPETPLIIIIIGIMRWNGDWNSTAKNPLLLGLRRLYHLEIQGGRVDGGVWVYGFSDFRGGGMGDGGDGFPTSAPTPPPPHTPHPRLVL